MHRIRRTTILLVATLLPVLICGPAAFATRVAPDGGSAPLAPPAGPGGARLVVTTGVAVWQVGLIAAGAALSAAILTAVALRFRVRASPAPQV